MFDLKDEIKQFDTSRENAAALAVLGYAQANLSKQRFLRKKYVAHLETVYPNLIKLADIEGEAIAGNYEDPLATAKLQGAGESYERREDYADEERDRTRNISNHDRTEDMRLDDPRHTEKR
jgi:hypothetical protein